MLHCDIMKECDVIMEYHGEQDRVYHHCLPVSLQIVWCHNRTKWLTRWSLSPLLSHQLVYCVMSHWKTMMNMMESTPLSTFQFANWNHGSLSQRSALHLVVLCNHRLKLLHRTLTIKHTAINHTQITSNLYFFAIITIYGNAQTNFCVKHLPIMLIPASIVHLMVVGHVSIWKLSFIPSSQPNNTPCGILVDIT